MTDIESLRFQLEVEQKNYLRNGEELIRQRDEARESAARHEDIGRGWMVRAEDAEDSLSKATAERDNWKFLQEETAKFRAEWQARAEKAERDLGECLAATNEVLKDALEQGKEADAPNQALVMAVRAAYRLGAEDMRQLAADVTEETVQTLAARRKDAAAGVVLNVGQRIRAIPVSGAAP